MTDGTRLVTELINLHDSLEASRGVQLLKVKEIRKKQTERYWTLRSLLAKAMDDRMAEALEPSREAVDAPAA